VGLGRSAGRLRVWDLAKGAVLKEQEDEDETRTPLPFVDALYDRILLDRRVGSIIFADGYGLPSGRLARCAGGARRSSRSWV